MPFALILIGALLVVAGIRNKLSELGTLLAGDFSGPGNFFYWVAGIGAVGAVGYYRPLQNVSRLFLALVVLAMLLSDQGFFTQLQNALKSVQQPKPATEKDVGQATSDQSKSVAGTEAAGGISFGAIAGDAVTAGMNLVAPGSGDLVSMVSGGGDILGTAEAALSVLG